MFNLLTIPEQFLLVMFFALIFGLVILVVENWNA